MVLLAGVLSLREVLCDASPQHYPSPVRQWHQLIDQPWVSSSELLVHDPERFFIQVLPQVYTGLEVVCCELDSALCERRHQDNVKLGRSAPLDDS